ncbi:MAG: peptide chain release factor 2 [Spirochaetales bacterium]|nr:peptide chain release factor 2 [Spirochaetales bacterium]
MLTKPGGIFDADALKRDIDELETITVQRDFWNDRERAEDVLTRLKRLRNKYEPWVELHEDLREIEELFHLVEEEGDESLESELSTQLEDIRNRHDRLKLVELLGEKYDENDAFLTIHSGAGGTEACDWVSMLLRMYSRWAERSEYKTEMLDMVEAEGGIKSVTLQFSGQYAYGYLHGETGIHRLVRISPFDSSARRHTSFASVYASPVIEDDIEVDIRPEDIRIDTYRSQGAGGQHVNKTDSAVRITHLATGIVVQCQNERSQYKNKSTAMKVLKSRLYEYYRDERDTERQKHADEKKGISWGNQIRSYVFHPYSMVKDHRTKHETGNVQAVMDGDIDGFIEAYLKFKWSG